MRTYLTARPIYYEAENDGISSPACLGAYEILIELEEIQANGELLIHGVTESGEHLIASASDLVLTPFDAELKNERNN